MGEDGKWMLYREGLDFRGDLVHASHLALHEVHSLFKSFWGGILHAECIRLRLCRADGILVRDRVMGVDEYPKKKDRQQTRRSLRAYEFRRVDLIEMLRVGYGLSLEHWQRLPRNRRFVHATEADFTDFLHAQNARGVEFWVGYSTETGEAAMWESVYIVGCMAVEEQERLSYRYKQYYPTYGLNHVIANYYLKDRGLRYVVAGARTVTEHSNVQEFLLKKMGFRKAYCKLKVWFRFPVNLIVPCAYPFRKLLPRGSNLRSLLMLVQFAKVSQ